MGRARAGAGAYRLEGAATGRLTTRGRDRTVTLADFRLVAVASPGVEVGRARVPPRVQVALAFIVTADGRLQAPEIDGVSIAKDGCAAGVVEADGDGVQMSPVREPTEHVRAETRNAGYRTSEMSSL